jgi:hypothetical protein
MEGRKMRNKYLKITALWIALVFVTALPVSAFDFHSGVAGGSDNEIQVNDSGQVGGITVGTDGQVVIGNTGNAPSFGTISDGEGIDTTLGAGTLGIACEDASETNKGILEIATDAEAAAETATDKALVPSNLSSISVTPDAHKDTHDPEDGSDSLDTAAASEIAGVQAAAEGSSHSFARADHAHQIQHGIVDNHLVTIDHASVADDDYAKFTADGIEGRSVSEVKTDLGLGTGDSPTFVTTKLLGLTDTYLPYHVDDATGLADSPLSTDGTSVGIGEASPSQELDLIGDLELEMTTSDDTGVIYKGANRFIHNFQHPTGNTAVPVGQNTFIGVNAGNFTMGSTATLTAHGSYNTGVGMNALYSNTTGSYNTGVGMNALYSNTTGSHNSVMGKNALYSNTTGSHNSVMGMNAGYYIADGSTANTTGDYNIFLGYDTKALADNDQNEIVIGYSTTGIGSNTIALGNADITEMRLANNAWISQYNFAGDAGINMFKVNVDDEIDLGATLKAGSLVFSEDSGAVSALDMSVSATPAANTEESYVFKLDGNNVLAIHSQADSAGGVFGLGTELSGGSVTTTDATVTTLDYLSLDDESAYTIKATVTAKQDNSDQRSSFIIAGLFYRNGGNATQQGATTVIQSLESDGNTACVFDVNGNNVRVRVTGIAAENWDWKCHLEIMKVD